MRTSLLHKLWISSPKDIADWLLFQKRRQLDPRITELISDTEARRLKKMPRYRKTSTTFLGRHLELVDAASFLAMCDEIFIRKNYEFEARRRDPLIIDCGSNIGLSIIYFKQLYPKSRIISFEPDSMIYSILQKNVRSFGLQDVDLFNNAVWNKETELAFHAEGAVEGKLLPAANPGHSTQVKTVRLRDFLDRQIDFLKIDVEGAESIIINDCADRLSSVNHLFIEYHSMSSEQQTLHELLTVLYASGFRYHVKEAAVRKRPFIEKTTAFSEFDLQLEIYAFKI